MIERSHRFRGYNSLRFVYQKGHTVRTSALSLRYKLNNRRKNFRVAVVVSRKVHKSAIVRNRIRRRIFEIVRESNKANPITMPYDLVFIVYTDQLATLPAAELSALINEQLTKANIRSALTAT